MSYEIIINNPFNDNKVMIPKKIKVHLIYKKTN